MQYHENMGAYQLPYLSAKQRRRFGGGGGGGGTLFCCRQLSPSKIDRCSRSAFPLIFITFNCLYWSVMTFLSTWTADQENFIVFIWWLTLWWRFGCSSGDVNLILPNCYRSYSILIEMFLILNRRVYIMFDLIKHFSLGRSACLSRTIK